MKNLEEIKRHSSVCTVHSRPSCLFCAAYCSNAIRERDEALKELEDTDIVLSEERARSLRMAKEAINERKWKEAYREFIKALPIPIEVADMEAKRIFGESK